MDKKIDSRISLHTIRASLYTKLMIVLLLLVVLQIPISCIQGIINERAQSKFEAEEFITKRSGANQTITPPTLSVPYLLRQKNSNGEEVTQKVFAEIFPDNLSMTNSIKVERRYRGIFEIPVYVATLSIEGTIDMKSFDRIGIEERDIKTNEMFINLGISDPRTIQEIGQFKFNDQVLEAIPGTNSTNLSNSGIHFHVRSQPKDFFDTTHHFSCTITLGGSQSLMFLPLGKTTNLNVSSDWTTPSFVGNYLPLSREVTTDGFKATWRILDVSRNFPRVLRSEEHNGFYKHKTESEFGVGFYSPVDTYRMTERAIKYELFILGLTFLVFGMFELFTKVKIHPIQYLLLGAAMVLFYLLLLSLSEQIGFSSAYGVASMIAVGLVGGYSRSVLKTTYGVVTTTVALVMLYGFFFTLLQEKEYSLLIGAVGLTVILGGVMYITRNIDWFQLTSSSSEDKTKILHDTDALSK